MNFLLDTNVVSEWMKPRPNPRVVEWLATADEDRIFLSVATLGELHYGIERLPEGRKRAVLEEWLETELLTRFEGRVMTIDARVASRWGNLLASADAIGKSISAMDGFQAATAGVHGMTLVTRDADDFAATGIMTFNPWED